MPLPRPKIQRDKPEVIRARQRLDPDDFSIVLAKTNDGEIVEVYSGDKTWLWPDGVRRPYAKWPRHPNHQPVPEEIVKFLVKGVADEYVFKWGSKHPTMLARNQGQGWRPVSKKAKMVYCPNAFGENVDDRVWHVGMFLLCRSRELDAQAVKDKRASQDIDRYLGQRKEQATYDLEEASEGHIRGVTQEFEPVPGDSFTVSPDVGPGDDR